MGLIALITSEFHIPHIRIRIADRDPSQQIRFSGALENTMPSLPDSFVRALADAHAEALRVGDSPLRADQLAAKLAKLTGSLNQLDAQTDLRERLRDALANAERALRRDDDGRQAAVHLKAAVRLTEAGPREPRKAPWE